MPDLTQGVRRGFPKEQKGKLRFELTRYLWWLGGET